jgi:RNA polymerase sigma-70 factor (family 1)
LDEKNNDIRSLWMRICQENDARAFEILFSICYPKLLNFCLLYVHRKEPAEEVVSDIFVKCWMDRQQLQHVLNPEVYLFVAVKNQALNYLKRFSHYHLVSVGEIDTGDMLNSLHPEKDVERREMLFRMNQAITMLPRQCQIIFRLVKEDGMKYKEVAEILHISPRTVQTQLFRAIAKLRLTLLPYLEDHSGRKVPFWIPLILLMSFYA